MTVAEELFADGTMDVAAACEFTGIRRTKLYSLMTSGELPYTQLGTRRLIPRKALVRLLAGGARSADAPRVSESMLLPS